MPTSWRIRRAIRRAFTFNIEFANTWEDHMFKAAIPVLHVSTSVAAEEYYCDQLGFCREFAYRIDEPNPDPCYMGLSRDGVELHISSFSGDGVAGGVVFLLVDDVDALHAELVAKGVSIALAPTDQSWGNREMYVKDADGNSIRFVRDDGDQQIV